MRRVLPGCGVLTVVAAATLIQNHPLYDGFSARLQRLKQRAPGQSNPFVVGREAYQRFLQVMSGCTKVQLERRGAA